LEWRIEHVTDERVEKVFTTQRKTFSSLSQVIPLPETKPSSATFSVQIDGMLGLVREVRVGPSFISQFWRPDPIRSPSRSTFVSFGADRGSMTMSSSRLTG
jgi:hypothetical protein